MADDSMIPGVAAPYMKLVAGFAGAVISLAFLKEQSRLQMLANVGGGCASVVVHSSRQHQMVVQKLDQSTAHIYRSFGMRNL